MAVTIAVIAQGAMGSGIAGRLVESGHRVVTVLEGRSAASRGRAAAAGVAEVGWAEAAGADMVLSVLPPGGAVALAERLAPGIAEAMRLASREHTDHWMLARNVAVIRGATLIVNFPGSPKAIGEAGEAIAGALPHALALLRGEHTDH